MPEHPAPDEDNTPEVPGDDVLKPPPGVRVISSGELLGDQREVWIEHRGDMYRLRLTSSGRLYLTK